MGFDAVQEIPRILSKYYGTAQSLDAPAKNDEEDGASIVDLMEGERDTGLTAAIKNSEAENMNRLLQQLTPRQKKVIRKRFYEDKTLQEVGDEEGVTRERIRQIEAKALEKLQKIIQRNELGRKATLHNARKNTENEPSVVSKTVVHSTNTKPPVHVIKRLKPSAPSAAKPQPQQKKQEKKASTAENNQWRSVNYTKAAQNIQTLIGLMQENEQPVRVLKSGKEIGVFVPARMAAQIAHAHSAQIVQTPPSAMLPKSKDIEASLSGGKIIMINQKKRNVMGLLGVQWADTVEQIMSPSEGTETEHASIPDTNNEEDEDNALPIAEDKKSEPNPKPQPEPEEKLTATDVRKITFPDERNVCLYAVKDSDSPEKQATTKEDALLFAVAGKPDKPPRIVDLRTPNGQFYISANPELVESAYPATEEIVDFATAEEQALSGATTHFTHDDKTYIAIAACDVA